MSWDDVPLSDVDIEDTLSRCGVSFDRVSVGYNFRCVVCGDSKTDPKKRRGYVLKKQNRYTYFCHNCHYKRGFIGFLKDNYPMEYDRFRDLRYLVTGRLERQPRAPVVVVKPPPPPTNQYVLDGLVPAEQSPVAMSYLSGREIPRDTWKYFYYAENYNQFLIDRKFRKPGFVIQNDNRIVVPFIDRSGQITHVQGRAIGESSYRYITQTVIEAPKIWGLDHMIPDATLYITEGVFDAVFLRNAIAMTGGSTDFSVLKTMGIDPARAVVCMDGDIWTNPDIRKTATKAVDQGFGIFVLPSDYVFLKKVKDFNDLVLIEKKSSSDIQTILNKFTYRGLPARVALKMM